MGATQEQVNQLVADTAAELTYEFGSRMPAWRFEGRTVETATVKVTVKELEALLRVTLEVGMQIEREGTT
jgi:hypothetical protein